MSAKRRKYDTRTILMVLLVLVIIVSAYSIITNLPPAEEYLTAEEVLANKDYYLDGQSITIKGFYIFEGGDPVIVSTLATTTGRSSLSLNFDTLTYNETDILRTDTKFKFTGFLALEDEDNPLSPVIFIVEKIEEV